MTYKVGPKGQVVLPKTLRETLGIEPGDEVLVEQAGDHIEIRRAAEPVELLGMLADAPYGTAELERERRLERRREEDKIRRILGR